MTVDQGEVLVLGGGIIGSNVALSLARRGRGDRVTVLEPDLSFASSSTARSAAAIRTQFHLGINVAMSLYGYEFYRAASDHLSIDGEPVDIGFEDNPYLVLSGPGGEGRMQSAHRHQLDNGADVDLLSSSSDFERVPWLKADGVAAATLGQGSEGWLDPLSTLRALQRKCTSLGVVYQARRAVDLTVRDGRISTVSLDDGTSRSVDTVVNAAGALAGVLAATASVALPVEARKRSAFVFRSARPPVGFTNLVDPTFGGRGIYARPFGDHFLAVTSPSPEVDHHTEDLAPDLDLFDDVVRPGLARRVRGFEDIELVDAWAGHYEMNTFDQNGIVGRHPEVENLILACGFSGHGVMHAPAVGRGVAELVIDGGYRSLDLRPFAFERLTEGKPLDDVQASEHRVGAAGV